MRLKEEILKGFGEEKKIEDALIKARGQEKVKLHEKYVRIEHENYERQRKNTISNQNLSRPSREGHSQGDF